MEPRSICAVLMPSRVPASMSESGLSSTTSNSSSFELMSSRGRPYVASLQARQRHTASIGLTVRERSNRLPILSVTAFSRSTPPLMCAPARWLARRPPVTPAQSLWPFWPYPLADSEHSTRCTGLVFLHSSGPLSAQTIPSLELFRTSLEPHVTRVSLRRQLRPRSRQLGQNHLSAKCS
jgi:hypothetical protein